MYFHFSYIPGFQMFASQKKTFWPQIFCDERDVSPPCWRQQATQQFCGHHQRKNIWIGGKDKLTIYNICHNLPINVSIFTECSPFNKEVPSVWVMWVLSWCGPAVLQQQHQVFVLMFEDKYLHIHRLANLRHCWTVMGRIERCVRGICRLKIRKKKEIYKYYTELATGGLQV